MYFDLHCRAQHHRQVQPVPHKLRAGHAARFDDMADENRGDAVLFGQHCGLKHLSIGVDCGGRKSVALNAVENEQFDAVKAAGGIENFAQQHLLQETHIVKMWLDEHSLHGLSRLATRPIRNGQPFSLLDFLNRLLGGGNE